MADIKLRIEVNPNAESEFLGNINTTNLNVANTSIPVSSIGEMEMPKTEFDGSNGLLWGEEDYLVFNDNDELDNVENSGGHLESEEEPDEFFWGIVPENKEYRVKLIFEEASNLKDIIVFGDKVNNQFPTEAIVDGEKTIFSDDYYWTIDLGSESKTHTIEFTRWNRSNYNACLTLIRVMLRYFEVDKTNGLKSIESLSQSTDRPQELFYGVIASDGSAEIIDINGEIGDMVNDGIIPVSNIKVEILANDRKLQEHLTSDSQYSINAKQLSLQLDNILSTLDAKEFYGIYLRENVTAYDLLLEILNGIGLSYDIDTEIVFGSDNRVGSIKDYLSNIIIPYGYLAKSNIMQALNKICELCQLNIFQDENGIMKFISARPVINNDTPIIIIPIRYQSTSLSYNLISNNKIKSMFLPISTISAESVILNNCKIQSYILHSRGSSSSGGTSSPDPQYYGNYINVLDSKAYNPTLTVLANHIGSEMANTNNSYKSYFSVAKYNINIEDNEDILSKNSYQWTDGLTIWVNGQAEETIESDFLDAEVFPYNYTDQEILADWVNFDENGNIVSVKKAPISLLRIRQNQDKTLTVFVLFGTDILTPVDASTPDYLKIVELINIHNYIIQYKRYSSNSTPAKGHYDIKLEENELIQDNTNFEGEKISNIITNNILNDYSDGIHSMEVSIICGDYYNQNGHKIKDWSKGEILQVGDIVRVDKDNNGTSAMKYANGEDMYFKVTGRRFRYSGVPLIDLELQEVKLVNVK